MAESGWRGCDGRTVVVTGAGRGIGRAHALMLARHGARVVVNDIGAQLDGRGVSSEPDPAQQVVAEIQAFGGQAVANHDDVSDWSGAQRIINVALESFGGLDAIVNNAGINRPMRIADMSEEDWTSTIKVHLGGTFNLTRHATSYWLATVKDVGSLNASIINTTSTAGLFPSVALPDHPELVKFSSYAAAKGGIAAFTIAAALELAQYGIRVNAVAPGGRTRMRPETVETTVRGMRATSGFDTTSPENNSPLVVWLASSQAIGVTGRVFETGGGRLALACGWTRGPLEQHDRQVEPVEIGAIIQRMLADAPEPTHMLRA